MDCSKAENDRARKKLQGERARAGVVEALSSKVTEKQRKFSIKWDESLHLGDAHREPRS